jgi:hypothetical protein
MADDPPGEECKTDMEDELQSVCNDQQIEENREEDMRQIMQELDKATENPVEEEDDNKSWIMAGNKRKTKRKKVESVDICISSTDRLPKQFALAK